MELNELLTRRCTLPSLPRAVALLTAELARPDPSLRRVNRYFCIDPALAADLLREANAASCGLPGQVCGIAEALVLLDVAQLRAVVAQARVGIPSRSVPGIDLLSFWRYSLNTAKLAHTLAGLVRQNQAAAYSVGLLHGLGEIVLHLLDPHGSHDISTTKVAPLHLRRAKSEQRAWGYSYAQVSAGLAARLWHLPQALTDALQYHTAPFNGDVYEPLAGVLHLAAWRARACETGLGERELAATFPGEVGVALGMDIDMVLQQDPIDWAAQFDAV